jgi:cell division control protein 6
MVLNEPNDENCNPFVRHKLHEDGGDGVQVEEQKRRVGGRVRTVPAKHGAPEQRVPASPAKINAHFRVGKSAIPVFEDGKDTPATPRHRDAVSKKVPITPRHRVLLAGSKSNPGTPRTPVTPSNACSSFYRQARQLFSRSSHSGKLIGREGEKAELTNFIATRLESESAGCLYVSGPPGTGKSAFVERVIEQFKNKSNVGLSTINCMSIRSTKDLSQKLSEDLGLDDDAGVDHLRSFFVRGKARDNKKYLVILDEVDSLVDLDLAMLYNLFEWSMQASSRLVLIGIANALDLTDRFLPRLKSRNLKPELLPFMPYTAAQIANVITSKVKSLVSDGNQIPPFLHPAAIQFCAKKVASQTGDLRKAFDICRRAIDLVEQETKEKDTNEVLQKSPSKTPLMENINLSSPPTPRSSKVYTLDTIPKATIAHMAKVTAQVFGNGITQRLTTLNLQQKAVLCALSALERRKRDTQIEKTMFSTPSKHNTTAPTIKQVFDAYCNLCKRENLLHPLSGVEFRDVVSGLETMSLLSAVDSKNGSFVIPITPSRTPSRKNKGGFGTATVGDDRRVASVVSQKELSAALDGAGGELLREILEGE